MKGRHREHEMFRAVFQEFHRRSGVRAVTFNPFDQARTKSVVHHALANP